ncbi:response regulator [Trichloromonas sp.]|uniref:response regulator n=1 Tax=Trichloromonas sp. TaxID=3069249 RepID=UPI003D816138
MLKKLILLPDLPELRRILENSFLRQQGFEFLACGNGARAFALVEEKDPLLVILGLDMEELRGDDCCRQIKGDPFLRATPVALVVRPGHERDLARVKSSGCDSQISAPFDETQVIDTVCRLLRIVERATPRVNARFSLQFGLTPPVYHDGVALNVNGGGLFIETSRPLPVDTLVGLELHLLPEAAPLTCRGRVAWVNHPEWMKSPGLPAGMGVQFVDPPETVMRAVRVHLEAAS